MQPSTLGGPGLDLPAPRPELAEAVAEAEQRRAISFKKRVRRQVNVMVLVGLLPVFFLLFIPLIAPSLSLGLVFLIVGIFWALDLAAAAFLYTNWTCPRCRKYLGWGYFAWEGLDIRHCRYCGFELR